MARRSGFDGLRRPLDAKLGPRRSSSARDGEPAGLEPGARAHYQGMMHSAPPPGIHQVSNDDLKRLLRALHRGALASPVTRSSLIEKGFGDLEGHLGTVVGRDQASAQALVAAVLSERTYGRRGRVDLSWMGPPAPGTRSRDVVDQVKDLVSRASQRVELYGLSLGDDRGLFSTLHAAMQGRSLSARLVFDAAGVPESTTQVAEVVARAFRAATPEAFVVHAVRLSMRAVVIDDALALVTSAELCATEEDGRVDAGALVEDTAFVTALRKEWERLCQGPSVVRVGS